jgi:hypothetical protein
MKSFTCLTSNDEFRGIKVEAFVVFFSGVYFPAVAPFEFDVHDVVSSTGTMASVLFATRFCLMIVKISRLPSHLLFSF